jgi:hypothetical protein
MAVGGVGQSSIETGFLWTEADGIFDLAHEIWTVGSKLGPPNVAVNDSGQVAGTAYTPEGNRAFFWTEAGGWVDIGPGTAVAVNESGQVAGTAYTPEGNRAFFWTEAGGWVDIGPGTAVAMNNEGQVVGNGSAGAFLWSQDRGIVQLPLRRAADVNDSGQVVGTAGTPDAYWPYYYSHTSLWTETGGLIDIGTVSSPTRPCSATPLAVNDSGQVLGICTQDYGIRPFVWTEAGGMIEAPYGTWPHTMNDKGQVVGNTYNGSRDHIFSWTEAGGMLILGEVDMSFGLTSRGSVSVSNSGRVFGTTWSYSEYCFQATLWKTDPDAEMVLLGKTINAMNLAVGTRTSLQAKFDGARAALAIGDVANTCGDLASVIAYASAQVGKRLTLDQAGDVIGPASDIRTMLQCL